MLAFVHTLLRCSFEVGAFVMLKRIHIQHLTLGMYLHEFCGSWMEHPFWRAKFLLKDPDDLARILATSIRECWIDTDKGADVAVGTASVSREEVDAQIETDFSLLSDLPPIEVTLPTPPPPPKRNRQPANMQSELQMAASICVKSKQAVVSMFNEARMGRAVDSVGLQSLVEEISDSVTRNPGALISLARLKTADDYTYMHSVAVCALMIALAKQLKLKEDQQRLAGLAGLMHDLGKAAIPLKVLNKPGKLTDQEFTVVRSHPVEGFHMLKEGGNIPEAVLDACLHHHEKVDGSGYPDKLKGDGISVIARMTAICDVYDAITSNRPYKHGWSPAVALQRMAQWCHGHLDNRLFSAFVKALGVYPPGCLVRLSSQEVAVVLRRGPTATTPRVAVVISRTGMPTGELIPRDTSLPAWKISGPLGHKEVRVNWPLDRLLALV